MNPRPAPFFNYRKRHRQAIISDPSQLSIDLPETEQGNGNVQEASSNLAQPSASRNGVARSGLMDVTGSFNRKEAYPTPAKLNTSSAGANKFQNNSNNSRSLPTKPYKTPIDITSQERRQPQSKPLSTGYNDKQYINNFNNDFFSNDNTDMWNKNTSNSFERKPSSGFASGNCNANQSSFNTNKNAMTSNNFPSARSSRGGLSAPIRGGGPFNGGMSRPTRGGLYEPTKGGLSGLLRGSMSGSSRGSMPGSSRGTMSGSSRGAMLGSPSGAMLGSLRGAMSGSSSGGVSSRYQQSNFNISFPSAKQDPFLKNSGNYSSVSGNAQHQNIPSSSMYSGNFNNESGQGKIISKSNTKVKEVDKSMRLFTCTISDIQEWTAQRSDSRLVLFEVFGIIDSAVLRTRDGAGKEFLLSDDISKIKCIFYEIDRELPKITRGQVHRVIGRIDGKNNKLVVLSIRMTVEGEKQIWDCATVVSKKEMQKLYNEQ